MTLPRFAPTILLNEYLDDRAELLEREGEIVRASEHYAASIFVAEARREWFRRVNEATGATR